jgi:hypothetical protein
MLTCTGNAPHDCIFKSADDRPIVLFSTIFSGRLVALKYSKCQFFDTNLQKIFLKFEEEMVKAVKMPNEAYSQYWNDF